MHAREQQHRMATAAKARREPRFPAAHRPPHQEVARGAALPIVVVDHPVGGAEPIELVRLAPGRDGGCQRLAEIAGSGLVLLEEELERVACAHALAEVGLKSVDAENPQDGRVGHALPGDRVMQAGIEAGGG
jgi:hypothetical protein